MYVLLERSLGPWRVACLWPAWGGPWKDLGSHGGSGPWGAGRAPRLLKRRTSRKVLRDLVQEVQAFKPCTQRVTSIFLVGHYFFAVAAIAQSARPCIQQRSSKFQRDLGVTVGRLGEPICVARAPDVFYALKDWLPARPWDGQGEGKSSRFGEACVFVWSLGACRSGAYAP